MKKSVFLWGLTLLFLAVSAAPAGAQIRKNIGRNDVIILGGGDLDYPQEEIVIHFRETHVPGFQASHLPKFYIASKNNRFLLGIGGFVSFRTAYDFRGEVQNLDFVTYDIPTVSTPGNRQRFLMGASTSRLFFKAIANTDLLGRVVTYIETDFRGYHNNLRLRKAYITFKGLLFGQDVTTFCDLNAAPTTIDFQGPNSYNFNFALMARYTHVFDEHWSLAAALEMPDVSATYSSTTEAIPQRLPDLPFYVQYSWKNNSHVRASAVFRDLMYQDSYDNKRRSKFGWGVQATTNIQFIPELSGFGQFVYGKGIAEYIQDVSGVGLDLVPKENSRGRLRALPMFGWFAGLQYNFTEDLFCSGTYGMVRVQDQDARYNPDGYRNAQYIVGNVFYNIIPSCTVGIEYLHGTRRNANMAHGYANRIQAMIKYNF